MTTNPAIFARAQPWALPHQPPAASIADDQATLSRWRLVGREE